MSDYMRRRENNIITLVDRLGVDEFTDDIKMNAALSRIKASILLKPVSFGEPQFEDYKYEVSTLMLKNTAIENDLYVHKICIPFTGDKEIFKYTPYSNFPITEANKVVVIPFDETLIVYVALDVLDPESAIEQARKIMQLTIHLVKSNNAMIEMWNKSVTHQIVEKMRGKSEQYHRFVPEKQLNIFHAPKIDIQKQA
ncbi:MAG: hypothetical protein PHV20_06885 [Bacteroidales bacterium]|nr:hypothetical protein [Bacteroidales bacterium]